MWFFSLRTARVNKAGKKINCLGTIIQWNRHFPASPKFFLRLHGSLRQRQPSYFNAMPWKSTWVRLLKKTFVLLRRWIYAMMIPQGPCDLCLQFNVILSLPFIHCFTSIQAILPLTRFFFLFHLMYSVDCFFGGLLDPFNCFQSIGVLLPQYPVDFIIVSRTLSALTFTRMFSK